MSSPKPPDLKVVIRIIVTMTTLHCVRTGEWRRDSNLQAAESKDQAKTELLTGRNLKQILDKRHRQDENQYIRYGVEKRL